MEGRIEVLPSIRKEGPGKIRGPKEILGPREITREEWISQVSSGEKLILSRKDEIPLIDTAGPDRLGNEWILFNRKRDMVKRNE